LDERNDMNIYLRLKNVPELKELTPMQRVIVHRACYQLHGGRSWKPLVGLLIFSMSMAAGILTGIKFFYLTLGWPRFAALFVGTLLIAQFGFYIYRAMLISYLRPYYIDFIKNELPKMGS
jgi:hypothetical protein